ncbi:ABC transporter substrate-binding protein [Pseudomonas indica]|uniref:ABC transporter substrate-binding protein n=1 Tax=Pseudomonas indica TaxID=137658 RepID=UPI0023F7AD46|nr:ABC transporter substrate-binding protein [Pseudomonas indica]MBU3057777.1 ABC transporter substrate-binding protein [Pseudomonas indica]
MPRLIFLMALLASLAAQAAEPIRIGLNFPRTGPYKAEGVELKRGALLAIEAINREGGVLGRPLELLSLNSASREDTAERNVDKFAQLGARMVFGGATSEEAITAGKRAHALGMLYFATLSYANEVTGREGHRYLFRESNSAWMSAQVLGEYLSWHMPRRRYHYIVRDDAWGRSMESALRAATGSQDRARHGYTRIPSHNARREDYVKAIQRAAESEADVLVVMLLGEDLLHSIRLARNLGLGSRMQIIVPNLSKSIVQQAGPRVMEGVIGTEAWTWRVPELEKSSEGQRFVEAFVKAHQEYPGSAAASAYGIVRQWADAVRRSGSLDSEALIAALENHRYQLLKDGQEWRAFDHQNVQSIYAVKVKARDEVMRDPYKQDYFSIIHRMTGEQAAPTLEDWQQERGDMLSLQ